MNGKLRSEKGYTITEVLVVLAIVGLLAGLAAPLMTSSVQKAREASLRGNLKTMRVVLDEYYADHLAYPETLDALVKEGYLHALPEDTIERDQSDWDVVLTEDRAGIMDVKSRSTQTALDGSIYADW
ncbi:type II secretion system GspH family protein (plasmid) [Aliiroseovarius crassostreae]|uniref:type II secretion system protein n=1 Tax=Aliiroseovarius crassostreae TaxID=154981 RepID=UPI002200DA7A|nr:type II secretion system GspH family protein [Aliiroseovarius crassostreae]UWQ03559.1 type II secretion system GspH family protein [Aliiroseovarius crassostreae]